MRHILAILFIVFSSCTWAEGSATEDMVLAKAPINQSDMESIKRGAKFFATNCMSCHTLKFLRYDKLAQEAGITYEKMPLNVKSWPYGITPPDLSLEADVRGVDWIYTYLHSFYQDTTRPTGANNLLVNNTAMPAILTPYQGEQVLSKPNVNASANGIYEHNEWYNLVTLNKQGTMTSEEFDATTADVTNFLAYASAPYYVEQHRIGWWVLGFLCILLVMMYLLKCEYWKDIKKPKKE